MNRLRTVPYISFLYASETTLLSAMMIPFHDQLHVKECQVTSRVVSQISNMQKLVILKKREMLWRLLCPDWEFLSHGLC